MPSRPLSSARESHLIQSVKATVPKLTQSLTKGQCGRIGIIGGCNTYTGSTYFSAISALKCGADLVHIFCEKEAGPVLRQYSPEFIIHPSLDQEYGMVELDKWLPMLDCVVVGHGLGKSQQMLGRISIILEKIKRLKLPVVIDGDGLRHVMVSPGVIRGYSMAVITTNTEEFSSLVQSLLHKEVPMNPDRSILEELCKYLGHVTIIQKGSEDLISDGERTEVCDAGGSPRRCGGQGDILSGILGTLLHWSHTSHNYQSHTVTPAWAACRLVRAASLQGFTTLGRACTASDIVDQIHSQFRLIFESETFL